MADIERQDPTAEDYSDMLREVFFQWAAGGYNDDGGLLPLDKAKAKLQWVLEEVARQARETATSAMKGNPEPSAVLAHPEELTNSQCQAACLAYEEVMGGERLPDGDGADFVVVRAMFRAVVQRGNP